MKCREFLWSPFAEEHFPNWYHDSQNLKAYSENSTESEDNITCNNRSDWMIFSDANFDTSCNSNNVSLNRFDPNESRNN